METKKEIEVIKEKAIVVQSNEIVEANYRLTTNEQKLILALITKIDTRKNDFEIVKISAKSLSDACGFSVKNGYRQLQQLIKQILDRSIILKKRDGSGWYGSHWLQYCEYVSAKNNDTDVSYVEVEFDRRLVEHFLNLKNKFLELGLNHLISFTHVYSTRFYMIFRNLVNNMPKCTKKYTFGEIIKMFKLTKSYQKTANLKYVVIKTAVDEINEKSDIVVEYKYYSEGGRAHVGVIFTFWRKDNKDNVIEPANADKKEFAPPASLDVEQDQEQPQTQPPHTSTEDEFDEDQWIREITEAVALMSEWSNNDLEEPPKQPTLAPVEQVTEKNKIEDGGVGERLTEQKWTEEQQSDYDNLLKIEVWAEAAKKIITTYDHARIERNYIGVMQDYKKGTIANLPAVVRSAIENDTYKGIAEEKRKLLEREQERHRAEYEKAQQAEKEKEAQRAKEQAELQEMEQIREKYTPAELNQVMEELKPIYQKQDNKMSDDIINRLKQYGITHNKFIRYTKNMFSFK